ncbi:MAG: glycosyltransferase family 4 protein [Roseivirga sp.]
MRILQVISGLGNGGAEKFIVELSNRLSKEHEVCLLSFRSVQEHLTAPKKIGPKVRFITLGKKKGLSFSLPFHLIKVFRKFKPDVVHLHLNSTIKYIYLIHWFFPKVRYVHTLHSGVCDEKKDLFVSLKRFPKYSSHFVNVCISASIYRDFKKLYPEFRFVNIDNGIEPIGTSKNEATVKREIEQISHNHTRKLFLAIGGFKKLKNFPMLVEALKKINANGIRAELILIGDHESANNEIDMKEVSDPHVHLAGFQKNVADYLKHADALLIGSYIEGLPLVVLEALATGTPIISTPVGGVPDAVVDAKNGFIASSMEAEGMQDAIEKFMRLTTDELQEMSSTNKKDFDSRFSMESCAGRYEELFRQPDFAKVGYD